MIEVERYLDFIEREYLAGYVPGGGAAVKFAAAADGSAERLRAGLHERARGRGFLVVTVNAAAVKVHMIDKVFAAIATQIDWEEGARRVVAAAVEELGFRLPPDGELALESLAAENEFEPNELRRDLFRVLQREILGDYELAHEFRLAMLRLCEAEVDRSDATRAERELVLAWLRGELRLISSLKQARIYQRIARHNARDMLVSLTHWVARIGRPGLVLDIDLRRCALSARPEDGSLFYTKAAVLDAYELLRQLIDATDELGSCFCLVTISPDTLTDPKRGIEHNYDALKARIWDEVRDRVRTNPLAALVRTAGEEGEPG
jgi:hypothetical protein